MRHYHYYDLTLALAILQLSQFPLFVKCYSKIEQMRWIGLLSF